MQRLIEIESQFQSWYQPLASTPRQHHTQMNSITTNPLQYLQTDSISPLPHQQQPLHQQFFPRAAAASQPSQVLQPKKLINNDKALPSGGIEETLSTVEDVIARYSSLKGCKLPALAVKLAKEAFFGEKIMKQDVRIMSRRVLV